MTSLVCWFRLILMVKHDWFGNMILSSTWIKEKIYLIIGTMDEWGSSCVQSYHVIRLNTCTLWATLGAGFVVSFFSGSRPLALKSSLKSLQMTTFLIQNEYWENNELVLVKTSPFWIKKVVIWWLFDDDFRARDRESEKKGTTNSAPYSVHRI